MRINLDQLSEAELVDLNHRVVERLRMLRDLRAHSSMMDFRLGERVLFEPEDREPVVGTLAKYNRKSVTVIADSGERWTVAPGFLKRAPSQAAFISAPPSTRKPEHGQLSLIKG